MTLNREGRMHIFKSFYAGIVTAIFANLFITVLQDIKEDFLVKIINVEASGLSSWAFAKIDAIVTLVILFVFGIMSLIKNDMKVLCALLVLVTCGTLTLSFIAFNYNTLRIVYYYMAVSAKFVPLYGISQFSNALFRTFHRLFPY